MKKKKKDSNISLKTLSLFCPFDKEQIKIFNKKGEELAYHGTFLNGKLEALKELDSEGASENV